MKLKNNHKRGSTDITPGDDTQIRYYPSKNEKINVMKLLDINEMNHIL